MTDLPSLIVFGSLNTWPSPGELQELRRSSLQRDHLSHIREAICRLPELWDTLLANDAALDTVQGAAAAEQLATWVSSGGALDCGSIQNNILSLPLTILSQLCDYMTYLQQTGFSHSTILDQVVKAGGVQGFCAGLLSALAVAGSRDEESVGLHGALSVRLAFAIGAYVDLDSLRNGQTSCLALRWKSPNSLASVQKVLEKHNSAYVSVIRDANEATITAPSSGISDLSRHLSNEGVSALDTGLTGRYHTPDHQKVPEKVLQACKQHGSVHFGKQHVVRSNTDGEIISHDDAVMAVSRDMLLERSNWHSVSSKAALRLVELDGVPFVLALGSDAVPSSISRNVKVIKMSSTRKTSAAPRQAELLQRYPPHAVAVIGMSCKFPGADSPDEFWQLLMKGTSMAMQVPPNRWPEGYSQRGNSAKGRFWGNFMRDFDSFDHHFFKKSSREAASMDPQQRLLLQGAYEAMESACYFSKSPVARARNIGCYLGLCATDYDANVASHAPNAFSTLGTLRAFLSGKISHFFGWVGPSVTIDTACSSSAVAIHTACRALQAGECTQALAGGIALFTSPYLYENLSAAHFLSPTGATKPFDAQADGYCRGEGVGLVVLKELSTAVADGDNVLAVIGGSAVNQNDNCVPIMVPNAPSQGTLYHKVLQQAGILPHQVSFVESHGTGTPVGDPIEMESIRTVFGGPQRHSQLVVSSVKGNIGHLEGASGVAGLIKAILQIENRTAALQASFQSLNPKIPPLDSDCIIIPSSNLALSNSFLVACVNNYGAAGSNSAMMIMQPPRTSERTPELLSPSKYPILIAANSPWSVLEYCRALRDYCQQKTDTGHLLGSIAFHLARQQNQSLPYFFATATSNMPDLQAELTRQLTKSVASVQQRPSCPGLVLVFGGQVRDYVGLSKQLWEQSAVLRFYLDQCDEILRSMQKPGLYPAIFQSEPIADIMTLHLAIFALQYASAKAWIECGLVVDALIGHSLGQLTALSVSGILSLEDGLKFVAGRASLMKTHWGPEAGAMIVVEADLKTLSSLPHTLEVACYNGPSSHVLVGDKASVDEFEESISRKGIRSKRLQVTNGFHSKFTDPIIRPLKELASGLRFNKPTVPIETCSEGSSWQELTPHLLAEHTRSPVFFSQAVQRLARSRGLCTWLEAGSDSGVIGMVRRVLDMSEAAQHGFQPMSLSKPLALDTVVDTTTQMWKRGHSLQFWNFHQLQRGHYSKLRLPSYQWQKQKHWLELLPPSVTPAVASAPPQSVAEPEQIPQLVRLVKKDNEGALFKIDPRCGEYQRLVSGHVVAGSPLCPATVYIEMAARACRLLFPQEPAPLLGFSDLRIDSPLGMAVDRDLTMTLHPRSEHSWGFSVASDTKDTGRSATVSHACGALELHTDAEVVDREFSRYERLTGPEAIEALYRDPNSESIQGSMLYKMFSRVVEYGGPYRGLKSVAAKNSRIAGTVVSLPEFIDDTSLTHPPTIDSFMQASGIHANSIFPCPDDEVYVFTKLDRLQFGPNFAPSSAKGSLSSSSWIIFSNLASSGTKELANDIFVFDAVSKRLAVLILGARFHNVRLSSLTKILSRVNDGANGSRNLPASQTKHRPPVSTHNSRRASISMLEPVVAENSAANGRESVFNDVCVVFERVADVRRDNVEGRMSVDDLGIDSLMMLEVINELSSHYAIDLPAEDMECLSDVDSLVSYLLEKGCGPKKSLGPSSGTTATIQSSRSSINAMSSTNSSSVSTPNGSEVSHQLEQLAKLLQEHLELASAPSLDANLADLGLDSLLAIELGSDIEKLLAVSVDLYQLDGTSTFRDLVRLAEVDNSFASGTTGAAAPGQASPDKTQAAAHSEHGSRHEPHTPQPVVQAVDLPDRREIFDEIRFDFDKFSQEEGFTDFWRTVYPDQECLVLSYTADAFKKLGGDLASIPAGHTLPKLSILPKHEHLLERMHKILADGGYIHGQQSSGYRRTSKPFDLDYPQAVLKEIISKFPLHTSEHRLLDVTASRLAECLTGKVDPLALLFANKTNRQLLANVYDSAPMCRATTRLLASFIARAFPLNHNGEIFHFLEVGGGTGGTTKFLVEYLTQCGIPFTYTFTDISSALVGAAKKSLAAYDRMRYDILDVEGSLRPDFAAKFHAIISTNCIHATRNATSSLANLRSMLRPDGLLALVEFTNGLYWFDLVYGLLDGWWLFSDGRRHALGDISFWERSLLAAGYNYASWTDGKTRESQTLRLICGFNSTTASAGGAQKSNLSKRAGVPIETVVWKQIDGLELCADIYYPPPETGNKAAIKRPIALLFHGGGHVVYTRKDINMKHIKTLLEQGLLPVSVDYRLCPEVNLAQGPMTDACDALAWVRSTLPHLQLTCPDVRLNPGRVAAVGWSSGGQLAMTLAYTAPAKGILPPDAILAFYCPSNFEAEWWKNPIYPRSFQESPDTEYDLLEGIRDSPIAGYKPDTAIDAPMTLKDPRLRIIIHYNWKAQLVPILVTGLPTKANATHNSTNIKNTDHWHALPLPPTEDIQAVSPYAQIVKGNYHSPTFLVHGDCDDLIPWQQSRDTVEALLARGVEAGLAVVRKAGHAFDFWTGEDPMGNGWGGVREGYGFLERHVF